jgi:Rieske Fe-S protein
LPQESFSALGGVPRPPVKAKPFAVLRAENAGPCRRLRKRFGSRISHVTGYKGPHGRQGITHGVVGSLIIASMIMQGRDLWQELYGPDRKTASVIGTFISENITAVKNFAEYVAPGEVSSFGEIERGKGAIVRSGLKKVAAYRDDNGTLHARSAVCTHFGCHLHWNSFERCWDCPCHGSQFSIDGAVLNGPAIHPLEAVEVKDEAEATTD